MNKVNFRLLSGRCGARLELRILLRETARAFGRKVPKRPGHTVPELLKSYARFTADVAEEALQNGQDLKILHQKLYHMACRLGSIMRRWLAPKDKRECAAVLAMLYRNIGITIRETRPGKFRVDQCYFSSFYTPAVCAVISAIDQGIFAGVFGGGRLTFRERITEGHPVCRADLRSDSPVTGRI